MATAPEDTIRGLSIWSGGIDIQPLTGGITNRNYLVSDSGKRAVVRLGTDIPVHRISRANELAAAQAAHAAGLSPGVLHHQPGILVLDFIEAKTLTSADINAPGMLERILPLVRDCHREIPRYFRGDLIIFWVFQLVRDYAATLKDGASRHLPLLPQLLEQSALLEKAAGPFDILYGHNDLLAGNFLDDGTRLWLIDWDYAGFNTPLFDLGGLASNNELSVTDERRMLELYFDAPATDDLWRRYQAMKCASLLREAMWSMVSEIHSTIEFDYSAYTAENLARFGRAYSAFIQD